MAHPARPDLAGLLARAKAGDRITANRAATMLARPDRARHQTLDTVAPDAGAALQDPRAEHDPEARSELVDERDRLGAALARLSPSLRSVVLLRDIYDLPHQVIAAELGISDGAAKVRLHRARRQLREHLDAPARPTAGPAPEMTVQCDEVAEVLPRLLEGPRRADRQVVRHVESCLRCQAELARYRRMLACSAGSGPSTRRCPPGPRRGPGGHRGAGRPGDGALRPARSVALVGAAAVVAGRAVATVALVVGRGRSARATRLS